MSNSGRDERATLGTFHSQSRIAIIGCGAIAERFYLPALARFPSVTERAILVDTNIERAEMLGKEFGIADCVSDYQDVLGRVDAAVLAIPDHLHHRVSMPLLDSGVHVLCEKPLAECAAQAKEMVQAADERGVTLATNYTRRLFPTSRKVKQLLKSGAIGEPRSIVYFAGDSFRWPTISGFYFRHNSIGRGVLLNEGSHVLDLICWWLGKRPTLVSCRNDSLGRSEAVASVQFRSDGCTGNIRLSWLFQLPNYFAIECELATIRSSTYFWDSLELKTMDGRHRRISFRTGRKTYSEFGEEIIDNFLECVQGSAEPIVSGRDILDSMELIDVCYSQATRFDLPWYKKLGRGQCHGQSY